MEAQLCCSHEIQLGFFRASGSIIERNGMGRKKKALHFACELSGKSLKYCRTQFLIYKIKESSKSPVSVLLP
jgi:hypothetical protein